MKVILATDGSSQSEAALRVAGDLALGAGDKLKIVTVIDMAVPMAFDAYAGYLPNTQEIEVLARENAEKTLEDARRRVSDLVNAEEVEISTEILIGAPESRIVETAEEFGATLIVVGSHGYNRWERLLLGSVSDSVVHHAPCSVLVVRHETEETDKS